MISGVNSITLLNVRKKLKRVFYCDSSAAKEKGKEKSKAFTVFEAYSMFNLEN